MWFGSAGCALCGCTTPEEAKKWIDELATDKVQKQHYKEILETIWDLQKERPNESVEYSGLAVGLQKGEKHLNIPKDELINICRALSRLAPEMISARKGSVELSQRPDKILDAIKSVVQEYPEEEQTKLF